MRRRLAGHAVAAAALLVIFLVAAWLFTRHNGFSYRFHPDEQTKARQIQTGQYNFYHPQLLLRGAQAVLLVRTGTTDGRTQETEPREGLDVPLYNRILIAGRQASASFAAGAVVLLAWVGYWQGVRVRGDTFPVAEATGPLEEGVPLEETGDVSSRALQERGIEGTRWWGRWLIGMGTMGAVGAALVLCPSLLVNAHFMKEDASLVLGVAAWVAAGAWYVRRPGLPGGLIFAAACGLVISGKWIGAVPCVAGLVLIGLLGRGRAGADEASSDPGQAVGEPAPARGPEAGTGAASPAPRDSRGRLMTLACATGVVLAVVLLVNLPILWQFERFLQGLREEAQHVATDHQGLVAANAPLYYLGQLREELGVGLLVLAGVELLAIALLPGRRRRMELWIGPLALVLVFATISLTRVVNPRYLLPVTVLVTWFAALGAVTAAQLVIGMIFGRAGSRHPAGTPVDSVTPAGEPGPMSSDPLQPDRARRLRGILPALACVALAILILAPLLYPLARQQRLLLAHFGHDRRNDLQAWAAGESTIPPDAQARQAIPPEASLLQESYVALEQWAVPFEVRSVRSVPAEGTPEELAARGYTHVGIAEDRWAQFLDDRVGPTPEFREEYDRIRATYLRLLSEEGVELVWKYDSPKPRPDWINPSTRVYQLQPARE